MTPPGSVSRWLHDLKTGEPAAAQPLWERYHCRLIGLARHVLQRSGRRSGDEEDVVQNTFKSVFRGMVGGRFPQLDDRDDLWRLLVVLTTRKAIDQVRRETRNGAQSVTIHHFSAISDVAGDNEAALLGQLIAHEPTPEMAVQLVEQYEILLDRLGDPLLRKVAEWKLEGFTNGEIAEQLGCARRTIIRKLEVIRVIWSEEPEP